EQIMPKTKSTWSSWNYRIENVDGKQVPTTIYWMNSLQQVSTNKNYFVSINALPGSIDEKKILKVIDYEHPLFDVPAIQAQKELQKLNKSGPLYFCGSYFNYGFHEDAYASAVTLSEKLLSEN
nr:NADP transhydrogenase subunit alpha [Bacteroidota bacterium]